jgi:hypothetical protein
MARKGTYFGPLGVWRRLDLSTALSLSLSPSLSLCRTLPITCTLSLSLSSDRDAHNSDAVMHFGVFGPFFAYFLGVDLPVAPGTE